MSEFLNNLSLLLSQLAPGNVLLIVISLMLVVMLTIILTYLFRLEKSTIRIIVAYVFFVLIISSYYLGSVEKLGAVEKPVPVEKHTLIGQIAGAIDPLSSIMLIIFFIGFWVYTFSCHDLICFRKEHSVAVLLTRILMGSLAATAFPTALLLILLSFIETDLFKPAVFSKVYFAFAGLSLTVISILIIYEEHKNIQKWLLSPSDSSATQSSAVSSTTVSSNIEEEKEKTSSSAVSSTNPPTSNKSNLAWQRDSLAKIGPPPKI